jgi:hypothetical protein
MLIDEIQVDLWVDHEIEVAMQNGTVDAVARMREGRRLSSNEERLINKWNLVNSVIAETSCH